MASPGVRTDDPNISDRIRRLEVDENSEDDSDFSAVDDSDADRDTCLMMKDKFNKIPVDQKMKMMQTCLSKEIIQKI